VRKNKLAIGICTYKRPDMLLACLRSIHELRRPQGVELRIVIADNDPAGSAAQVIEAFRQTTDLKVYYQVETGRGIPFARNNVLRQAEGLHTDLLAFIDDDETADTYWINNLFTAYTEAGSDVVRGYVKTVYPPDTPKWIVKGGFYQRKNLATGTKMTTSLTGNVLFNFQKLCVEMGLKFDESIGLQGGSDSDFFRRAHEQGAVIRWVADAVVYETLEPARFKLSYLLKRKFRTRNGKTFFRNISLRLWLKTFLSSWKRILLHLFLLPLGLLRGFHHTAASLGEIAAGAGRLLGLFGIHPGWDEYNQKE